MKYPSRRQLQGSLVRPALAQRLRPPFVATIGAPVGGLNARDALEDMPPEDAIKMDNMLPGFGKVSVRRGSTEYIDLATAEAVETLATLNTASGRHFFAASGGSIWNITNPLSPVQHGSGAFNNDRWQTTNMNGVIAFVNGSNTPQTHNGSALSSLTVTGMSSTAIGVNVFKSRSYFWGDNSQTFYYSAVNTLGGAVTAFPLGDVGTFGGKLMAMVTWTKDGGAGQDDLAVFIMSSGDVIIYAGDNPGDAAAWALVGVFKIGAPIGRRCATKIGGDVLILTVDGPVLLSAVLPGGRGASGLKVLDKLGTLIPDQFALSGTSFGWEFFHYPLGRMAFVNYPVGGLYEQLAVNLTTGAWGGPLKGMNANCWALFDDRPYFGTSDGRVVEADTGTNDDGVDVVAECRQAFNYFGRRNMNKQVLMIQPLLEAASAVTAELGLSADFSPGRPTTVTAEIGASGGVSTPWGSPWGSPWSTPIKAVQAWVAHSARGYAISPSIRIEQSDKRVSWNATRISFVEAGMI